LFPAVDRAEGYTQALIKGGFVSLVLDVDIDTGSCRCALYNQELQRLSNEIVEYATQYPRPEWAEQDPEVIFASNLQAMEETVSGSGMLNVNKLDWEDTVLALAGISRKQLPAVVEPTCCIESIRMRGILFGLSLHHSQAHVIRSLIEGICYRLHSVIQPLEKLIGKSTEIRVTGGFTRSPLWLQILSDILGRELMVSGEPEGSVLGAAAFAYHTLGMIDSFEYLLERNPIIQNVRPEASAHEFYQTQLNRYMHLYWKFQKEFV
jgi:sugar (pentulose or hexulose) kinase